MLVTERDAMSSNTEKLTPEAIEIRRKLLEQPGEQIETLMRWQIAEARSDKEYASHLLAAVNSLDSPDTPRPLRKIARKTRFLLENLWPRGQESEVGEPNVAAPVEIVYRGWLSSTDSSGCCVMLLSRPEKPHLHRLLRVLAQEGRGIISADEETLSTHDLETSVQSFREEIKPGLLAEVDSEFVRHKIASGVRETREAGFRVPSVLAFWKSALEQASIQEHPAVNKVEPPAGSVEIETVLYLPPSISWVYELPMLEPATRILRQAEESKIAMENHVREQRNRELQAKAAEAVFDQKTAARYFDRLLDLALIYHSIGDQEKASLARASADQVEREGGRSRFALALLQKSYAYYIELERQRRARKVGI